MPRFPHFVWWNLVERKQWLRFVQPRFSFTATLNKDQRANVMRLSSFCLTGRAGIGLQQKKKGLHPTDLYKKSL